LTLTLSRTTARAFILKTLAGVIAKAHHSSMPLASVEAHVKQTTTEMGFVMTSTIAWDRTTPAAFAMAQELFMSADAMSFLPALATVQVKHSSTNAVFVGEMEKVA
jgi:hypothetical protein